MCVFKESVLDSRHKVVHNS